MIAAPYLLSPDTSAKSNCLFCQLSHLQRALPSVLITYYWHYRGLILCLHIDQLINCYLWAAESTDENRKDLTSLSFVPSLKYIETHYECFSLHFPFQYPNHWIYVHTICLITAPHHRKFVKNLSQ